MPDEDQTMIDLASDDAHHRTLTAFFDTRGAADQAIADLEAAGVPRRDIQRLDGGNGAMKTSPQADTGFFATLKELFMPEEDRSGYAEGLQRGGFLVSVKASEADHVRITDILDRDGAVDMDEREASWRQEGWTGYTGGPSLLAPSSPAGKADASGLPGASTGAAAAGTVVGAIERGAERLIGKGSEGGEAEYIPVVEERLKVGKRDVSHGRVRLRSYVVETPVQEQVSLHDERVQVDRRRVDRPATAADDALFRERTIELEEFAEEAVVSKEARVVEEIALRKEAVDRTETIRDTVRSTKVDIDDGRSAGGLGAAATRFAEQIRDDMVVVGSDGGHVGTVDHIDGGRIKLKKADAVSGGEHHYLTHDLVRSVAGQVVLAVTAAEAKARWAKA